jgi:hypothetical protein
MTPATRYGWPSIWTGSPTGLFPGQKAFANRSVRMTAGDAPGRSSAVKSRPARRGMPRAWKYPGLTWFAWT